MLQEFAGALGTTKSMLDIGLYSHMWETSLLYTPYYANAFQQEISTGV